ncbi:GNAT family N-acetyltransferase [Streptomyces spectabilis]|uniref:GNAT family N-acetyltransferase n=1 Tax=Streptomyces spectabilis TaxID=68270 RepID=A0A516RDR8_STRST|nr:GNAT family N-acetyltransferase [Streptomyces spectabilis]QDQ13803.1 GNAT family N-acetyltransferase [Streptomyces spectabilis]
MASASVPLGALLTAAARGEFPPADGTTTVVPQASPRDAGVLSFTAHTVVFTDEDPDWVRAAVAGAGCDPLAATMSPRFLAAFADRTGRAVDTIDLVTVATAVPGPPDAALGLRALDDPDHPRVARALKHRDDVRVWASDAGGVVTLGRGVAGRWEVSVEVDESARHRGLGRALASAARCLVPAGGVVWAQQAPGNARSVRAFQAAGFRPVGAEALFFAR